MPELPEVEVVRRGLAAHVIGRTITAVRVHHPRAVRRHEAGPADLTARLLDTTITGTDRRGKYLWLTLDGGAALVVHLGMSGQMLLGQVPERESPADRDAARRRHRDELRRPAHVRRLDARRPRHRRRQRGARARSRTSRAIRWTRCFDRDAVVKVLRRKHSEIKRQLLDQTVVSGIGNIYADESLWRAKVNGARLARGVSRAKLAELLDAAADVMTDALGQGGTSFDSLYVNVNGESGYFDRSLDAYGREGEPCRRCGAVMRREKFMNRSSFYCPRCQPRPRA